MPYRSRRWVVALATAATLSGCAWNYGLEAGVGADVCTTLTVVESDGRSLTSDDIATVGDLRSALRDVQRGLASAQESSEGLARAVLGNLRDATTTALGVLSDRDDATPVDDLPPTVGRTSHRLLDHIRQVREKVGCE